MESSQLKELKERVDLVEVIESQGHEIHGHGNTLRILCPFHADARPSLIIQPRKQWWYCHAGCGGGDVVEWIRRTENCSFTDAVQKLQQGKLGARIVRIPIPKKEADPVPPEVIEEYVMALESHPEVHHFCTSVRHWGPHIISTYKIGFDVPSRRITIPVPAPLGGHWRDVRKYHPRDPWGRKMLPYDSQGRMALPLNLGGFDNPHLCILTEGEPDGLALASLGIPTATHTCGAKSAATVWEQWSLLITAPRVFICYDLDEAGATSAQRVADIIGERAQVLTLPGELGTGGDITDAITKYGAEAVRNWFRRKYQLFK